ncbi:permease prefix domain 1-containing protein [Paenibacillus puerhi]|uniref:permease prefix domain 1-containing protein n=1 Tax=Paenibacillus puerhi TaxID=2692622 RepID=UPI00135BEDA5|nr:permease prefix domain 1-containing protein [Paenibacillus puerhi]
MDTIISYLDNMFGALPRTGQVLKLKQDLLAGMEEKYHELKSEGKSENEAIGIVISEFGNIDELVSELGIGSSSTEEMLPLLTEEETDSFIAAKSRSGLLVGIGVALCLAGVALLILLTTLAKENVLNLRYSENGVVMSGLIGMLLLVAPAIGLFIYSGRELEKYSFIKEGFALPDYLQAIIRHRQSAFNATYTLSLVTGVCLCVLSPVAIFVASVFGGYASSYGVVVMLAVIACAVFLFVYYGSVKESYSILLKTGEFSKEKKEENRVMGAIGAIVWPLAVCIFLISGLVYQQWHINWIIFPITGILFGVCGSVYNTFKTK